MNELHGCLQNMQEGIVNVCNCIKSIYIQIHIKQS